MDNTASLFSLLLNVKGGGDCHVLCQAPHSLPPRQALGGGGGGAKLCTTTPPWMHLQKGGGSRGSIGL